MKKKCYIYIRVSTAMQVDGYSLEAQKERLIKFAEFQDMEVVREYCDAGKSGKSITGRPEFQRMLQDVSEERDGVAFILVFKLSRFGRNAADVLNSLQFIQDYGVNLVCVEDGIDSSKDSGKLTITVLSAVAEIERENILVQTMEGRKQKAREGKWNGGQAPFGYDLDSRNSTLVVNEEEAEIVRIIYDKFVHTDMGADVICNYLNQRGYTKKKVRGHELNYFARGLIMKILDNPVYTGKIAYGKNVTEKVKGTRDEYRRVKTDDYLLADGLHEAIVDEETWEAAREKRKRTGVRFVKTHSLEHEHILTGLIRCPLCGGGMSGTVQRRQNKKTGEYKDTFYYRCHHRKKVDGKICDYKPMLNQKMFNAEVEEFIRYMVAGDEFRKFVQEKLEEKVDVSALETEREQLQKQLKQVQGSKLKLIQMLDRLDTGDKHYTRKYQDMQDRLDNLYDKVAEFEEAMKDIDAKIGASYGKEITGKKLYEFLLDFDILYDKMTDMEKKEFMNTFIEKIELKNETVNNGTGQGSRIEHIDLAFPVYYGDCKGTRIRMPEENTVETVVLLSHKKPDGHINVKVEFGEGEGKVPLDNIAKRAESYKPKERVTYKMIKEYIEAKYGFKVHTAYIAEVKRDLGLPMYDAPNAVEELKQPRKHSTPEKVEAIKDALKHFEVI
ncbi:MULTISPECIES: recombinase family protein [Blautia]|uniref:recombinase family protein n=2 Tax=Lachnospiraceae TaxID=186803 RepID=UPI002ED5BD3F